MAAKLVSLLALIIAFQLFFMCFFLLAPGRDQGNKIRHSYLGVLFLLLGINMLDLFMQQQAFPWFPRQLSLLDDTFLLLYGPLLFLYVNSVVSKSFNIGKKETLYFLPFALVFLLLVAAITGKGQFPIPHEPELPPDGWLVLVIFLFYAYSAFFLWRTKKLLWSYDRAALEYYSNLEEANLKWLHFMVNSFTVLCVLGMLQLLLQISGSLPFLMIIGLLLVLVLFILIYRSIYVALKGSNVLLGLHSPRVAKYAGFAMPVEKRMILAEKLQEFMEKEQAYLNPALTINEVASGLQVSTKELSQVINQDFGQHFFDFVNSYRIDAAKELLQDPENKMTIQEIMYTVGFSSKSSFNTLFKKKTSQTPSTYRTAMQSGNIP